MVSVDEAVEIINSHTCRVQVEEVDLHEAVSRVLAEQVKADRDFPPFNRVAMDGIALMARHASNGHEHTIEGIQPAGVPAKTLNDPYNCIEVMTGAMLPDHTDTVVPYEDIEVTGDKAKLLRSEIKQGMNVHKQGQDARAGDVLLEPGQMISSSEVALLASVGKSKIKVYGYPATAVISSGDELVDITVNPEPHQIRQSNTYALRAAMSRIGWSSDAYYLVDNKEMIKETLKIICSDHDVLILSGGVSKGKFDFVPDALEELGFKKMFHRVSQRPGKPFWFGISDEGKTVFAFPGNPVSTFLCFHKYAGPWLLQSMGVKLKPSSAILKTDFKFDPELTCFLQVKVEIRHGKLLAEPVPGGGSGDFANLKNVDGFLELPLEKADFREGEAYPYIPFRD